MKLLDILIEAYKDLKADKPKDPETLVKGGWIKIPKDSGQYIFKAIHVTDEEGVEGLIEHLGEWQISSIKGGKIGKVGNRVVVFDGWMNKKFIGDGHTVVGDDGFRYYKPELVKPEADYNELIVIPDKILRVYDVTNAGDVIYADQIYKDLYEKNIKCY